MASQAASGGVGFPESGETMIERLDEQARLSGAVVHGATVYLAGQIAEDTSVDAKAQTADILRQIDALLAQAGHG